MRMTPFKYYSDLLLDIMKQGEHNAYLEAQDVAA